jgi:hypothetical protein
MEERGACLLAATSRCGSRITVGLRLPRLGLVARRAGSFIANGIANNIAEHTPPLTKKPYKKPRQRAGLELAPVPRASVMGNGSSPEPLAD